MSSGPKTRGSYGPTSPRGQAAAARKKMEHAEKYAPGLSLDMPDEPVKKMKKGGKIKKMAGGGTPMPVPAPEPKPINPGDPRPVDYDPGRQNYNRMMDRIDARRQAVVNNRMKGGPRMRSGGSVSSASKRADGIAVKGKTRGKIV